MSESVKAVGEGEAHGVINGTSGVEHDKAEHVLQEGGEEDESDEYDDEEADYEEEKQIVGDEDDEEDEDYEEGDDDDHEGDDAGKPSMTHLLLGNPNAPVDGDDFDDEEEDDEEEDYEPEPAVPTKKRSREELGEDDAQDSKKVKA
jgi:hypothetical protein